MTAQAEDDKADEDGVKIQPLPSSLPSERLPQSKMEQKDEEIILKSKDRFSTNSVAHAVLV